MHLSQLFSSWPKLFSKTTSFLVVSASTLYICGAQREQGEPLLNRTNYTKPPPPLQRCAEKLVLFSSKQTMSNVSLLSLPAEQTNIQSKPRNKQVQIFLSLLHLQSLVILYKCSNSHFDWHWFHSVQFPWMSPSAHVIKTGIGLVHCGLHFIAQIFV